ncbi:MAG: amidohydrolase [Saprospiraceae bacterium]|nr:amidohydrolase [Saprospiraceae bacterium]
MRTQIIPKIKELASLLQDQLVEWRNHLHRWPELSFKEQKTSAFIQQILDQYGIVYKSGFAQYGIVGTLHGHQNEKRVIALRADMDALPIQEKNNCSYSSQNEGVMHACGHDVHMTWLLGALIILQQMKTQWGGTVKFIFQPGEEKLPGGASIMIAEGALENPRPDVIIGQHVQPGMDVGVVGLKAGQFMASCDELYIDILGKGGHAALAHLCIDPIKIASQVVIALQNLVDEEKKENQPIVLSIGKINSLGGATNVIPDQVRLEGTFRCLDESFREHMHSRIRKAIESICEKHGASASILIDLGYPSLINDENSTNQAKTFAMQYLGHENVEHLGTRMTSEDFAYYSQKVPAIFYRTGIGKEVSVHNPNFDIDERCLPVGAGLMAYLAMQLQVDLRD